MAAFFAQQRTAGGAAVFSTEIGDAATFTVTAGSVPSTMTIGVPSASFSFGSTFAVAAASIDSTVAIGIPSATFSLPFSVAPAGIASGIAIGAPSVSATYDVESLLTLAQAQQYLMMALGVELPSFIVQAAIERSSPYVPAMVDAGYSHADQVMVLCISVALIAAAGMPRRLASQAAPSGASRGFKYTDRDLWALRRSLAALDTAGVMTNAVGPDPTAVSMFMVV